MKKFGLEEHENPNNFIEYSNNKQDVYKRIAEYNPNRNFKVYLLFDYMIADISNQKANQIVTELFIRGRKLNISTAFITQSNFAVPRKKTKHFYCFITQSDFAVVNCKY